MVRAYHFICAAAGQDISDARKGLNTYTLANYSSKGISYLSDAKNQSKHYSEDGVFGFIYGKGEWGEKAQNKVTQLRSTRIAMLTPWGREVAESKGILLELALAKLSLYAEREIKLSRQKIFLE
jgi:hypothetical protein